MLIQKYMTTFVHKHLEELFQLLITHARFSLLYYFLSFDNKAMTLHKVPSLHTSFFKTFN